jgi:APA family basic amino acid/polyamine antiporter
LKIVLLLGLITGAVICGDGSLAHFQATWTPSSVLSGRFATSLIFVSFAYSGWNAAAYLGGEIEDAGRNLPNSIIAGTLFVTVLYLLLNVVYVYAVSPSDMSGVAEVGALAATRLFGDAIGSLFGFLIAFLLLSTLSAMIMTGPRVYYAMGRDGVFFPSFGSVDAKRHVPRSAILLQAGIAIALVLTSTFESLLIYIGFLLSLFASLTVLGLMKIRIREPARHRAYRAPWFPFPPLLFVLGNGWIVLFSLRGNLTTVVWGGVTVLLGLFVFEVEQRRSARGR